MPDRWPQIDRHRCIKTFKAIHISCLLVLSCCLLLPVAATGDPLDRLFFTPQDRAHLEKLRWASAGARASGQNQSDNPKIAEDKPQFFALKGTVTKKSGFQALWLNDLKYTKTDLPVYVVPRSPFFAGQILLRMPETGKSYRLRPGQTLDITNGRIREAYEPAPKAAAPKDQSAADPAPLTKAPAGPIPVPGGSGAPKP